MKQICAGTWKVWCDRRAIATAMPWNWQSWKAVFSSIPQVGYLIWLVCFLDCTIFVDLHSETWDLATRFHDCSRDVSHRSTMRGISHLGCLLFLELSWKRSSKWCETGKNAPLHDYCRQSQHPKLNQSYIVLAVCWCYMHYNKILNYFLSPSLPVCFFILVGSQSRSLGRELRALENTLPQWQRKYAQKQPLVASVVRCGLLWKTAGNPAKQRSHSGGWHLSERSGTLGFCNLPTHAQFVFSGTWRGW